VDARSDEIFGSYRRQLLVRMQGAMKLHGEAGTVRDTFVLLGSVVLRGRGGLLEVIAEGQARPRSDPERTVELAEADDDVADALEHFARSDD
jgi:hypothetical protein